MDGILFLFSWGGFRVASQQNASELNTELPSSPTSDRGGKLGASEGKSLASRRSYEGALQLTGPPPSWSWTGHRKE